MKLQLIVLLLLLLPGVVFAQTDIGNLIFRDILKMSSYPGSPFTGNIINDIVMFLFIPTVFIIVIIYTLAGRLTDNTKIDLLLSVAFYLFIVFGGYYSIFALLAGPYFLFLIIIMGLFYFFLGHFGLRRAGTGGGGGGRAQGMPGGMAGATIDADTFVADMMQVRGLTSAVRSRLRPGADTRTLGQEAAQLRVLTDKLKIELNASGGAGRFKRMNPIQARIEGHQHLEPNRVIHEAEETLRDAERHGV